MYEPHEGTVSLSHGFAPAYYWPRSKGELILATAAGTSFTACAQATTRGQHAGEQVVRFFQGGTEFARAYKCCWGHYYNCNRTRIGMYCVALDWAVK
jgi:hypothetical protein